MYSYGQLADLKLGDQVCGSHLDGSGFTIISPVDSMATSFVPLDGDEVWILKEKNEGLLIIAFD